MRRVVTAALYVLLGLAIAWTIVRFWPQYFNR
jgi:hypothetical protein